METQNKLTVTRGGGRGEGHKEGEVSSRNIYRKDSWSKTMVGRIECGRWEVSKTGENNGEMGQL